MRLQLPQSVWRRLGFAKEQIASAYNQPLILRLLTSGVLVALATLARMSITPIVDDRLPYATYYLAVELSALLFGLVSGLFATSASAVLGAALFSPDRGDEIALILFVTSCAVFAFASEALHRGRVKFAEVRARQQADIAARKRIEALLTENARRLQATIDASPDAVLTMDARGQIQSINRAGTAMFDYSVDEAVRMNVRSLVEVIPGDDQPGDDPIDITAFDAAREIRARRQNGKTFPAELTLSGVNFNGEALLVAFIKDLTEPRRYAQRVEELRRSRLTVMNGMADTLAHEINQPLAATAAYLKVAQRLLEKSPSDRAPEIVRVLAKASQQTLRAGSIVTNLRNLIRRREPDKTLASVNETISETVAFLQGDAACKGISIAVGGLARRDRVLADRTQLRQVLTNLVRNAVEAMDGSKRRELLISSLNPDHLHVQVDVVDTGCGLPDSLHENVFEPFTTTKASGMGVGLSISKSIIEAHDGKIWTTPNKEGGAVFSFALPIHYAETAA